MGPGGDTGGKGLGRSLVDVSSLKIGSRSAGRKFTAPMSRDEVDLMRSSLVISRASAGASTPASAAFSGAGSGVSEIFKKQARYRRNPFKPASLDYHATANKAHYDWVKSIAASADTLEKEEDLFRAESAWSFMETEMFPGGSLFRERRERGQIDFFNLGQFNKFLKDAVTIRDELGRGEQDTDLELALQKGFLDIRKNDGISPAIRDAMWENRKIVAIREIFEVAEKVKKLRAGKRVNSGSLSLELLRKARNRIILTSQKGSETVYKAFDAAHGMCKKQIEAVKEGNLNIAICQPFLKESDENMFRHVSNDDVAASGELSRDQVIAVQGLESMIDRGGLDGMAGQLKIRLATGTGKSHLAKLMTQWFEGTKVREVSRVDLNSDQDELLKIAGWAKGENVPVADKPDITQYVSLDEAFFYGEHFPEVFKGFFPDGFANEYTKDKKELDEKYFIEVEKARIAFIRGLRSRGIAVVTWGASENLLKAKIECVRTLDKLVEVEEREFEIKSRLDTLEDRMSGKDDEYNVYREFLINLDQTGIAESKYSGGRGTTGYRARQVLRGFIIDIVNSTKDSEDGFARELASKLSEDSSVDHKYIKSDYKKYLCELVGLEYKNGEASNVDPDSGGKYSRKVANEATRMIKRQNEGRDKLTTQNLDASFGFDEGQRRELEGVRKEYEVVRKKMTTVQKHHDSKLGYYDDLKRRLAESKDRITGSNEFRDISAEGEVVLATRINDLNVGSNGICQYITNEDLSHIAQSNDGLIGFSEECKGFDAVIIPCKKEGGGLLYKVVQSGEIQIFDSGDEDQMSEFQKIEGRNILTIFDRHNCVGGDYGSKFSSGVSTQVVRFDENCTVNLAMQCYGRDRTPYYQGVDDNVKRIVLSTDGSANPEGLIAGMEKRSKGQEALEVVGYLSNKADPKEREVSYSFKPDGGGNIYGHVLDKFKRLRGGGTELHEAATQAVEFWKESVDGVRKTRDQEMDCDMDLGSEISSEEEGKAREEVLAAQRQAEKEQAEERERLAKERERLAKEHEEREAERKRIAKLKEERQHQKEERARLEEVKKGREEELARLARKVAEAEALAAAEAAAAEALAAEEARKGEEARAAREELARLEADRRQRESEKLRADAEHAAALERMRLESEDLDLQSAELKAKLEAAQRAREFALAKKTGLDGQFDSATSALRFSRAEDEKRKEGDAAREAALRQRRAELEERQRLLKAKRAENDELAVRAGAATEKRAEFERQAAELRAGIVAMESERDEILRGAMKGLTDEAGEGIIGDLDAVARGFDEAAQRKAALQADLDEQRGALAAMQAEIEAMRAVAAEKEVALEAERRRAANARMGDDEDRAAVEERLRVRRAALEAREDELMALQAELDRVTAEGARAEGLAATEAARLAAAEAGLGDNGADDERAAAAAALLREQEEALAAAEADAARRKAELDERLRAEEDARRQAELGAAAEEGARLRALAAEEEARLRAEEDARRQAELDAAAEEEARLRALAAEEEARLREEEDARRQAELDAAAEEEARLRAEAGESAETVDLREKISKTAARMFDGDREKDFAVTGKELRSSKDDLIDGQERVVTKALFDIFSKGSEDSKMEAIASSQGNATIIIEFARICSEGKALDYNYGTGIYRLDDTSPGDWKSKFSHEHLIAFAKQAYKTIPDKDGFLEALKPILIDRNKALNEFSKERGGLVPSFDKVDYEKRLGVPKTTVHLTDPGSTSFVGDGERHSSR